MCCVKYVMVLWSHIMSFKDSKELKIFSMFTDDCSFDYVEEQAKDWLENVYSPTNFKYNINATQKSWEYNTNINDETSAAKV